MKFTPTLARIILPIAVLGASTVASAVDLSVVPSGSYEVDSTHAYLNFSYSHLGLSNPTLAFDDFTIDLNLDNADPTKSMVLVSIESGSVFAGSEIWHNELVAEDYFDAANHPKISFQSTNIEAANDDQYTVEGDLTIKGQSKPVTLTMTINAAMNHPMSGKPVIGISAAGQLLRSEFGLGKLVPHISDEIDIDITAELVKVQ